MKIHNSKIQCIDISKDNVVNNYKAHNITLHKNIDEYSYIKWKQKYVELQKQYGILQEQYYVLGTNNIQNKNPLINQNNVILKHNILLRQTTQQQELKIKLLKEELNKRTEKINNIQDELKNDQNNRALIEKLKTDEKMDKTMIQQLTIENISYKEKMTNLENENGAKNNDIEKLNTMIEELKCIVENDAKEHDREKQTIERLSNDLEEYKKKLQCEINDEKEKNEKLKNSYMLLTQELLKINSNHILNQQDNIMKSGIAITNDNNNHNNTNVLIKEVKTVDINNNNNNNNDNNNPDRKKRKRKLSVSEELRLKNGLDKYHNEKEKELYKSASLYIKMCNRHKRRRHGNNIVTK